MIRVQRLVERVQRLSPGTCEVYVKVLAGGIACTYVGSSFTSFLQIGLG